MANNRARLRALVSAAFITALPGLAHAQATIKQLGPVQPGHLSMYAGNGQLMDAGGIQAINGPPVNGQYPGQRPGGIGTVNSGLSFAAFEKPTADTNYSQLMWGFDGSGNGLLTFDRIGTGGPFTVNCRINGTLYSNCLTGGGGGGAGTVTQINTGGGITGGPITGTGTITLDLIAANSILANATGGFGVPTSVALPDCDDTAGQHLNYTTGAFACGTSGAAAAGTSPAGSSGDIQINSSSSFGALTPASGVATWLATPSGANLASALTSALPPGKGGTGQTAYTDGQLLIGNTATGGLSKSALTAGSGISIANGNGSITITNTGGGGGGGSASAGASGDIQTSDGAGGFVAITPGTSVAAFLATPAGGVPASWLASGAAVSNLGFTPPPNTRSIATGTGLSGGGNLTADRTLSVNTSQNISTLSNLTSNGLVMTSGGVGTLGIAVAGTNYAVATSGAANTPLFNNGTGGFTTGTRSGNTTAVVTQAGSTPATNDCAKWDASHNLTTAGVGCGAVPGGAVGSIQYALNSTTFGGVTLSPGLDLTAGTLSLAQIPIDRSSGNASIPSTDGAKTVLIGAFTYTLPTAGSSGFGANWGTCFLNIGAANATITTTTSTFKGAGGTSTLTLAADKWACPASWGTNYITLRN